MSGEPRLSVSVNKHLAPILRAEGFVGSGATFRRVRDQLIHVVNVQGSRHGGRFYVNLSIQPLAIEDAAHREPNSKTIKEYECEFRRRLGEWWDFDRRQESMDAAVIDAAKLYESVGKDQFDRMTGASGRLAQFSAQDYEARQWDLCGFGNTAARMALNMMRLRRAEGRIGDALQFAEAGLRIAPPVPGWMRAEFEAALAL
jgi:hypothetical protein